MRRANQEGTYQKIKSGKVRLVVMEDGRRVYGPAAETRREARAAYHQQKEAKDAPAKHESPILAAYFYQQLQRLQRNLAPTTYALYVTVYETLINTQPIGVIPLPEIEPTHVQAWYDRLAALKPRSSNRYLQCLKAILEHAVRTGLLEKNPATAVRAKKADEHHKTLLDRQQVDHLLAKQMSPRLRLGIMLCLHGLRRAEACGLKFEDFDGDGLNVKRQALEVNGELVIREATKTGKSRWVPVNADLKALLSQGEGWVLKTSAGTPLRPRNLAREWSALVKGTEYEGLTLHDLRSTMGMLLLEKGVDVRTAAEILGHSPAMLASIYARSRKELKKEALLRVYG